MKKKVISALLASTMIVSLVACGSTGGDSSDTNSKSSGTTASSTAGGDEAKDNALISSTIVLATNNLSKTFGLIAVYGGSSLSFAGVTLPLNNAPLFTKFWANIIPYTPYVYHLTYESKFPLIR